MISKNKIDLFILTIIICIAVFSAWIPPSGSFWFLEASWPIAITIIFLLTAKKFRFSSISYAIVSIWIILHLIGARYTFEKVPLEWLSLNDGRNYFDRIAHFAIGLNAYLFAELFFRKKYATNILASTCFAIIGITAIAGVWEIIEWIYADTIGGESGAAFLGAQGDIWDAQKDILCDTLGAIIGGSIFFIIWTKRQKLKE